MNKKLLRILMIGVGFTMMLPAGHPIAKMTLAILGGAARMFYELCVIGELRPALDAAGAVILFFAGVVLAELGWSWDTSDTKGKGKN